MEGLNSLPPEYLILICEFTYASHGRTRYLPNEVRRFLIGKSQQSGKGKRPGLPERIAKRFRSRLLTPLYFSLIKHPIIVGGRLVNAAVGAIAVYYTPIVNGEEFARLCSTVKEEWQKHFSNVKEIREFKIIAGYGVSLEG
jgi:hypothetical protein